MRAPLRADIGRAPISSLFNFVLTPAGAAGGPISPDLWALPALGRAAGPSRGIRPPCVARVRIGQPSGGAAHLALLAPATKGGQAGRKSGGAGRGACALTHGRS